MNVFCWLYNLRDDYIIAVDVNMYCYVLWPPPGPKTGVDFWGQVRKRVWKMNKNEKSEDYSKADLKQHVLFL